MRNSITGFATVALTAGLYLAVVAPSSAATVQRLFYQNGGSACTGALPTFEGALRKRPKAIGNEGTTTAFVTCSAVVNDNNSENPSNIFASFTNNTGASVDVNCSLINGDAFFGSSATPQTLTLTAGTTSVLGWFPVSPATTFPHGSANISCALAPGVSLNYFGQQINEDIGA
jgi:hypothetical protein